MFGLYFARRAIQALLADASLMVVSAVGVSGVFLGEFKTKNVLFNRLAYPVLHCIWHASIYYLLYRIV